MSASVARRTNDHHSHTAPDRNQGHTSRDAQGHGHGYEGAVSRIHPCQPNPCQPTQLPSGDIQHTICVVNRECQANAHQHVCKPYKCIPGCRVGEMSDMLVPHGTYVRIRLSQSSLSCSEYKVCYCAHTSQHLTHCENKMCMRSRPCHVDGHTIVDGSIYHVSSVDSVCIKCMCQDGHVVCNHRVCPVTHAAPSSVPHGTSSDGTTVPVPYDQPPQYTGLPCSADRHYIPVCGPDGRTYVNKWVAECLGLSRSQYTYQSCNSRDPCISNPCSGGHKCIARRQVCLSNKYLLCKQYECVAADCDVHSPVEPVCDVLGRNYTNICHLAKSGATLSHYGQCRPYCSSSSIVCGHNGETYSTECEAWAAGVAVDYPGACRAVGLGRSGRCTPVVQCSPVPSYCAHRALIPPGACCPVCGGEISVLYSRHAADQAGRDAGITPVSVEVIVSRLRQRMMIAHCELFAYISVEDELVILVLPHVSHGASPPPRPIQVEACVAEAERLENLIRRQNPIFTADVILSVLTSASELRVVTVEEIMVGGGSETSGVSRGMVVSDVVRWCTLILTLVLRHMVCHGG